eukprot:TRINITY_DN9600_c0_g2_i2.p1 TRINITY_DN9600_c0_g2~~TRINITY_DN9600_c0_g2_i2.p1  ORF type:complete len:707 (-),score=140.18 TRINITY_DN9600_c0_g2_i2:50-2170(-)
MLGSAGYVSFRLFLNSVSGGIAKLREVTKAQNERTQELAHFLNEPPKRHEDALQNVRPEVAVLYSKINDEVNGILQADGKYEVSAQVDVKFRDQARRLAVFRHKEREKRGTVSAFQVKCILEDFRKFQGQPDFSVWPLHDPEVSKAIMSAELDTLRDEVKLLPTWRQKLRKGMRYMRLTVPPEDDRFFDALEDQYGRGVEFSFIWAVFFVRQLWVLSFGCVALELFDRRDALQVGVVFWAIYVACESMATYRSQARVRYRKSGTEHLDILSCARMLTFVPSERMRDKRVRWAKLLLRGTIMVFFIFSACLVLVFMTMLVLHIIYIWGDCLHLHKSLEEPCRDAQHKWGLLGWVAEVCCDILLAIIFELLMSISSVLSDWLADAINFEMRANQLLFGQMIELVLCTAGRIGFAGSLAYLFVPQWEPPSEALLHGKIDLNYTCADMQFGEDDFRCYQVRLPAETRRWLFTKLMTGPFVVAPIVSIIVKFVVPSLVRRLAQWSTTSERRTDRWTKTCAPCRCVLRLLAVVFTFDPDAVDGFPYIYRGWPYSELPEDLPEDARDKLQFALEQSVLKEFQVEDELMELEMSFLWVATLFSKIAEVNTDLWKLLLTRRRPCPVSDFVMRRETNMFMACVAAANVGWSVGLSLITFNDELYKYGPVLQNLIFWGVIGWMVLSVLIIASTVQRASFVRTQRHISPNIVGQKTDG